MAKQEVKTRKSSTSHKSKHKGSDKKAISPPKENLATLTKKVLEAVKQYFAKIDENAIDLVEKRRQVFVNIGYDKCPEVRDLAHKALRLEGAVNTNSAALLIVQDEATKEKLEEDSELSEKFQLIIDLTTLKNNFSTTQARRNLFKDYDAFYCDRRIIVDTVGFLGYEIRNSWRRPIQVKVPAARHLDDTTEARRALLDQYTHLTSLKIGEASQSSVRIGALGRDTDDLVKNLLDVTRAVETRLRETNPNTNIEAVELVCAGLSVQLVEPTVKNIRLIRNESPDEDEETCDTTAED